MVFFIYAGVSLTALTLLNCRDIGGQYLVLERYPNVRCWDSHHIAIALLSFPILAGITLGVPGFIILRYRLMRARWDSTLKRHVFESRRQNQQRDGVQTMADEVSVVKIAARFVKRILPPRGYLRDARMYRAGIRGWFPSLFFLRRAVVVVAAVYLEQDQVWRQVCVPWAGAFSAASRLPLVSLPRSYCSSSVCSCWPSSYGFAPSCPSWMTPQLLLPWLPCCSYRESSCTYMRAPLHPVSSPTRALLYVRGSYVATVAASQTLTVRGACVGEQICLHAHCCCHVQDEHLASGRDVFILFLNVVLLATPAIYLAWVHGGKFYRSINKRLERGWLCFKPRLSKAHMATLREAEQRMANHHLDDDVAVDVAGIEMKTTASEDDAKRRKKKKKKKQAEIRRNNPVAFTDMTPDTL